MAGLWTESRACYGTEEYSSLEKCTGNRAALGRLYGRSFLVSALLMLWHLGSWAWRDGPSKSWFIPADSKYSQPALLWHTHRPIPSPYPNTLLSDFHRLSQTTHLLPCKSPEGQVRANWRPSLQSKDHRNHSTYPPLNSLSVSAYVASCPFLPKTPRKGPGPTSPLLSLWLLPSLVPPPVALRGEPRLLLLRMCAWKRIPSLQSRLCLYVSPYLLETNLGFYTERLIKINLRYFRSILTGVRW